jgi:Domain of unknown function DUF1828
MSRSNTTTWAEALKRDWCEQFAVTALPDGAAVIETPFVGGDGDGLTIVVERNDDDDWVITDRGYTRSWFQLEAFNLTPSRQDQLARVARRFGARWEDDVFTMVQGRAPEADDVARFVQMLGQAYGVPDMQRVVEGAEEQFRTVARRHIRNRLVHRSAAVENWTARGRDERALFPADIWIPSRERPVVAFFAASEEKVNTSLVSAHQYRDWGLNLHPIIVFRLPNRSRVIDKASMVLGNADVIPIVQDTRFEYAQTERRLDQLGVELVPS